jgi:hypothetical protein
MSFVLAFSDTDAEREAGGFHLASKARRVVGLEIERDVHIRTQSRQPVSDYGLRAEDAPSAPVVQYSGRSSRAFLEPSSPCLEIVSRRRKYTPVSGSNRAQSGALLNLLNVRRVQMTLMVGRAISQRIRGLVIFSDGKRLKSRSAVNNSLTP